MSIWGSIEQAAEVRQSRKYCFRTTQAALESPASISEIS